jgi:hypothetical protein
MHLKVFLKLKNPKNSLFWANIYKKNQKTQKKHKNTHKKTKNPLGWFFFYRVFSNPAFTCSYYLYLVQRISGSSKYQCSAVSRVGDLLHFGADPDLDPRIRTSG